MAKGKVTPGVLINTIRQNQNNNKTLKALFANQFLGKFSMDELEGLKRGIDKEINRRSEAVINEKIEWLEKHGYKVNKKK